jgi:hypothetical protein
VFNASTEQVNVIAVPEPGAIALAGAGVAIAAWMFRSRRRTGRMKLADVPGA